MRYKKGGVSILNLEEIGKNNAPTCHAIIVLTHKKLYRITTGAHFVNASVYVAPLGLPIPITVHFLTGGSQINIEEVIYNRVPLRRSSTMG